MVRDVKLSYKRVGELYDGKVEHNGVAETFSGATFAGMMGLTSHILTQEPDAELLVQRTDREGLLPARLEPALLHLLRTDPAAYIQANTIAPRTVDLRSDRTSALAAKHETPRHGGLRHGLSTLADAFGEVAYSRAKKWMGGSWRYEHPATGRWADLTTIEFWLGSHATEVQPVDANSGWLLISVELLLKTHAARFYYPREWNEFGSWITRERLQEKLERFRKEKSNVTR